MLNAKGLLLCLLLHWVALGASFHFHPLAVTMHQKATSDESSGGSSSSEKDGLPPSSSSQHHREMFTFHRLNNDGGLMGGSPFAKRTVILDRLGIPLETTFGQDLSRDLSQEYEKRNFLRFVRYEWCH